MWSNNPASPHGTAGFPAGLLAAFEIVPVEIGGDRLFTRRFDTKYLLPSRLLPGVLADLPGDYCIAAFGGRRVQNYESVYFDDSRLTCYQDHQRGKLPRQKARFRKYLDSGNAFLEIKRKTNQKTTHKWRRLIPPEQAAALTLYPSDRDFIRECFTRNPGTMVPRIRVRFSRLCLKSRDTGERVTMDRALMVTDPRTGDKRIVDDFIIAEVKQARISRQSPFRCLMSELALRPASFSKYCFGIYTFYPRERHNRLKRNYRFLGDEPRQSDALLMPASGRIAGPGNLRFGHSQKRRTVGNT